MSESPSDLVQLWPEIFRNLAAAKRAVQAGLPQLPGFVAFRYQVLGPNQKVRTACYDPTLIPDPVAWLQQRLKALVRLVAPRAR